MIGLLNLVLSIRMLFLELTFSLAKVTDEDVRNEVDTNATK